MTTKEIEGEKLKFLMNIFDKIQDLRLSNPLDSNLPEIERLFIKHAQSEFSFQKLRLTDIHEESIEKNITKQAHGFYKSITYFTSFPIVIQQQLLGDYSQMEHQRRRNNFERYCQCIYQQLEAIVNQLWDNGKLWTHISQNRNKVAFSYKRWNSSLKTHEFSPVTNGFKIQNVIFKYSDTKTNSYYLDTDYNNYFNNPKNIHTDKKNHFQVKLRAILFVLYFEEKVLQEHFDDLNNNLSEITIVRNTFHRGPSGFTMKQQGLITTIIQNESIYYHKFFGLLSDFIYKVLNSNKITMV